MAEHGGYRKPNKPAPVSGPGRLSRRTDGGPASQNVVRLPNAGYGENAEYEGIQSAAPMAASAPTGAAPTPTTSGGPSGGPAADLGALLGGGGVPAGPPTPLTAPSELPDQPITAGAPIGAGPGPMPGLGAPNAGRVSDALERLAGGDLTGEIADLYTDLRARGL